MVAIPFMLKNGKDFIEIRNELKETKIENSKQKEQIIKRNEVLNIRYNQFNQLIEEKEVCTTTQKILIADAGLSDEIIKAYELLSDSLSGVIIKDETKDNIVVTDIPNLTPIELKTNPQQNTHIKKELIKTLYIEPTKKRFIRKLFKLNK